ncbi:unnamed protein product [Cylindrotheca closterium]|uniref:Uncharacterized protein n=1 Tax=Cylindrotheca closterium TaxID=2856 RepID=A0AAD2CPX6_9STRA|nr:unnamed protein product [Cylindrotheca closterium]
MTHNSGVTKPSFDEHIGNASEPHAEENSEKGVVIQEEAWTNADGSNVFDLTFENNMVRSTMKNLFPHSNRALVFDSYSEQQMTPLDMLYEKTTMNHEETADENDYDDTDHYKFDDFYDGTGSLVWLACIAFCHLVAQDLIPPLATTDSREGREEGSKKEEKYDDEMLQICELGCGAGLASIATLLSSLVRRETNDKPAYRKVIFTDNDPEALELAKQNCELNQLDPELYDCKPLSWGILPDQNDPKKSDDEPSVKNIDGTVTTDQTVSLQESTMDIVLAADVIYDISMIPPLLQTAAWLIKPNGSLVVSHVPRFCLPKDENEQEDEIQTNSSSPQQALEAHIIEQAGLVGLELTKTIRPHETLVNVIDKDTKVGMNHGAEHSRECHQISCATLEQAHAVLFVFEPRSGSFVHP